MLIVANREELGSKHVFYLPTHADIEVGRGVPPEAVHTAGASPSEQPRSRYGISTLSPLHTAPPGLSAACSSLGPPPAAVPAPGHVVPSVYRPGCLAM